VDLELVGLLSKVYALCEERHAIMDCPFVPFHTRVGIVRHAKLQNVAGALMDQPQEQEPLVETQTIIANVNVVDVNVTIRSKVTK
jgi:hypothetical protein